MSKGGLRNALRELEEAGEWVAVRSLGRQPSTYHPMFINGARTDLLASVETNRIARQQADMANKAAAQVKPVFTPIRQQPIDFDLQPRGFQSLAEAKRRKLEGQARVSPERLVASSNPWVKTYRDEELLRRSLEAEAKTFTTLTPDSIPAPRDGYIVDVLLPDNLPLFLEHGNPGRIFVAGGEDRTPNQLTHDWLKRFGSRSPNEVTYSSIQDVYATVRKEIPDSVFWSDIDAAMYVAGYLRRMPTVGFVLALLRIPAVDLPKEMLWARQILNATLTGRTLTRIASKANHYGNYSDKKPESTN
jgi:hypothetical protein